MDEVRIERGAALQGEAVPAPKAAPDSAGQKALRNAPAGAAPDSTVPSVAPPDSAPLGGPR
jgi:hypothetical protein